MVVAILLVFLIVVTYTALEGLISVVRTDVVQGVLMIVAAVLLFRGTLQSASRAMGRFARLDFRWK